MNNQFSLWQITPYFLILILCFVIFQMWQSSKNEIEFNVRDSIKQAVIEKYEDSIKEKDKEIIRLAGLILVNEAGTVQQRVIYLQRKQEILNQKPDEIINGLFNWLDNHNSK